MKKVVLLLLILTVNLMNGQIKTADQLITTMHKKYANRYCKTVTFTQDNTYYENGKSMKSVWFEAIEYPDKFRIDFGDPKHKDGVIFKSDSAFLFKKGVMTEAVKDENKLLLLLGGMYFRKKEDALKRIQNAGFDLKILSLNVFQNNPVYVIGANKNDTTSNQIWVEQENLRVVKLITKEEDSSLEMRVETFQKSCDGFQETKVSFYRNGLLEQIEEYRNIETNKSIPVGVFDPKKMGKVHWLNSHTKY